MAYIQHKQKLVEEHLWGWQIRLKEATLITLKDEGDTQTMPYLIEKSSEDISIIKKESDGLFGAEINNN